MKALQSTLTKKLDRAAADLVLLMTGSRCSVAEPATQDSADSKPLCDCGFCYLSRAVSRGERLNAYERKHGLETLKQLSDKPFVLLGTQVSNLWQQKSAVLVYSIMFSLSAAAFSWGLPVPPSRQADQGPGITLEQIVDAAPPVQPLPLRTYP